TPTPSPYTTLFRSDDARPPGRSGRRDHAPRRGVLRGARRERRERGLSARERDGDRSAGAQAERQRRHPARRRQDGLLPHLAPVVAASTPRLSASTAASYRSSQAALLRIAPPRTAVNTSL